MSCAKGKMIVPSKLAFCYLTYYLSRLLFTHPNRMNMLYKKCILTPHNFYICNTLRNFFHGTFFYYAFLSTGLVLVFLIKYRLLIFVYVSGQKLRP